ncbi:8920_t:CDS:2 [Gigaspora margarita]|uniref:8920_t:CDS:1 n=1 Tax=Gigaspora margarita TaxID=4874 RepID=A0ABN7WCT7_GIGMA|nr:8920_t:CDS:2 [Gigaspora margarita]
MSDSKINLTKHKGKVKEKNNIKKPRKILTGKQKKQLCQFAQDNPTDILAQSTYWLGLDDESLILQEKAKKIAATLKIQDFAASDETASAPVEKLSEFHQSLQNEISNYDLLDIYNCDEMALYWLLEPSKSLTHGRIAVFIHKFETPHSIRGIKKSSLPVHYYWNKKACMQTSIFQNWLSHLDRRMCCAYQKILLLVDNCSAHSIEGLNLCNIKVVFLLKNTTAWLQLCDARIIYSFKFVLQAWNKVSENVNIYSWQKTGILSSIETNEDMTIDSESLIDLVDLTNNDENELEDLMIKFQNLKNSNHSKQLNISTHEFIKIDNNYVTGQMPTIEDIVAEMQKDEHDDEQEQVDSKPVIATQAITGLDSILNYIEQPESDIEINIKVFAKLK